METDYFLSLEIKEAKEDGTFSGVASVYGKEDLGGDVIEPGAFTKTLAENPTVPLLWQHKSDEVIGEITLREAANKILAEGKIDLEDPMGQKAYGKLKKRLIKGLSIGFQALKSTWEEIEKDGRTRFVRHINELKLWETSIVTFAMAPQAQITRVKSAEEETLERRLASLENQVSQALSVRSSTPVSVQEPEPRETKEPPVVGIEPELLHSKLLEIRLMTS